MMEMGILLITHSTDPAVPTSCINPLLQMDEFL